MSKKVRAYAPASIGNVSVGFDILGAAVSAIDGSMLGDEVFVEATDCDTFQLDVQGKFADKLPGDPKANIVTTCYQEFATLAAKKGQKIPPVKLTLVKHLPIGSGLGSSACSVVAAIAALNSYFDNLFSENECLLLVGELEGKISGSIHYDNVAPCFLGGIQLMSTGSSKICQSLPVFENWYWLLTYSGINVSTAEARKLVPNTFDMKTTIKFAQQLACFVDASYRKDQQEAAAVLIDLIAEPSRKSLLPRFDETRSYSLDTGALAFGISGSGPTIFTVTNDLMIAENIQHWQTQNYIQNELGFSRICKIDNFGTQVSEVYS